MLKALTQRIAELETEIDRATTLADKAARAELLEDLERHVEELEARGGHVPPSARARVRPGEDEMAEDFFDNMPI
ncbi:hypothetical protein AL036_04110 [Salipiger aestuarii]|uniref:Uncharacterized protein n=1 Tax=Salipiger aestuarii TaxID=568098 RepID=A0A327YRR7_9RHOB|nr:hypothetical protein [Salipiger aestuarii]EIE50498.1 hypothetical protein C357_14032 [Citreicella sp. 357]KAA8609245.1 hypothetical protein AL036_04110 [Salipiger aestuarii]KAA8615219.1 hypothetical protein AL037_03230 [Salipiger aestuarii]KAB2542854.1 hypothetical protein AL035_04375 [Salipiger aestuarii]RAK20769.1 hypothetical protein ATI53_100517 [Salipiger aestuarii]